MKAFKKTLKDKIRGFFYVHKFQTVVLSKNKKEKSRQIKENSSKLRVATLI